VKMQVSTAHHRCSETWQTLSGSCYIV
jgi:hypothetical protein